ncbi:MULTISPECIES: hypothetical protein [Halocynthiibacter]|uniref:Uncharacterized protein n=1 Tax=Halocynthiibacter halioticoli TaxID=2986804 RepID=A0AAE3IYX6_9RHOB|nr:MULTISPECIES: hypothetical protein [Halocynthiibacter]MCV6824650.1 hypothetical protein [Halocynthiibacter halioticoli]MCW4057651.1 hypothetical protein [Halocynthiibacter sp. SDUM655004]
MSDAENTLPTGWELPVNAAALETELAAELAEGHPLFGRTAAAVAQSSESDEAVFSFTGDKDFIAVVALTWEEGPISGQPEFEVIPDLAALDGFFDQ